MGPEDFLFKASGLCLRSCFCRIKINDFLQFCVLTACYF